MSLTTTRSFLIMAVLVMFGVGGPSYAGWVYDMEGAAPAGWFGSGNLPSGGTSSSFISMTHADGGSGNLLRLMDGTTAGGGGSFSGFAGTSEVFSDVQVIADVNVALDSDDDLGVVARGNVAGGSYYFGSVDLEHGNACITKIRDNNVGTDIVCSAGGLFSPSESYTLALTAMGSSTTELTLSVTDSSGNVETVSGTDDGSTFGFGGAYTSGVSGVLLIPHGSTISAVYGNELNGTFDNVSSQAYSAVSMPEPGAGAMFLTCMLGMLGLRRRAS